VSERLQAHERGYTQMKLRGMIATDYQDVLRTLGLYVDEHGLSDISVIETDDGFMLQGTVSTDGTGTENMRKTYVLTGQDIRDLLRLAYGYRGRKSRETNGREKQGRIPHKMPEAPPFRM